MPLISDKPGKFNRTKNRWWVLVNKNDKVMCIRQRRQSCIRFALDSYPAMTWARVKRTTGWKVARCVIYLEE